MVESIGEAIKLNFRIDISDTYSRAHLKMGQWGKVRLSAFKWETGDMSDTYLKRSHHDSVSPEESHGPMEIDALMIISPHAMGSPPY